MISSNVVRHSCGYTPYAGVLPKPKNTRCTVLIKSLDILPLIVQHRRTVASPPADWLETDQPELDSWIGHHDTPLTSLYQRSPKKSSGAPHATDASSIMYLSSYTLYESRPPKQGPYSTGLFTGEVKHLTRPAKLLRRLDLTRPDPRDFDNLLTRPDPT